MFVVALSITFMAQYEPQQAAEKLSYYSQTEGSDKISISSAKVGMALRCPGRYEYESRQKQQTTNEWRV
jgi:hypothetical protein